MTTAYTTLGIFRDVKDKEIIKAFRMRSNELMSKKLSGALSDDAYSTAQRELNEAYQALGEGKDPDLRAQYNEKVPAYVRQKMDTRTSTALAEKRPQVTYAAVLIPEPDIPVLEALVSAHQAHKPLYTSLDVPAVNGKATWNIEVTDTRDMVVTRNSTEQYDLRHPSEYIQALQSFAGKIAGETFDPQSVNEEVVVINNVIEANQPLTYRLEGDATAWYHDPLSEKTVVKAEYPLQIAKRLNPEVKVTSEHGVEGREQELGAGKRPSPDRPDEDEEFSSKVDETSFQPLPSKNGVESAVAVKMTIIPEEHSFERPRRLKNEASIPLLNATNPSSEQKG